MHLLVENVHQVQCRFGHEAGDWMCIKTGGGLQVTHACANQPSAVQWLKATHWLCCWKFSAHHHTSSSILLHYARPHIWQGLSLVRCCISASMEGSSNLLCLHQVAIALHVSAHGSTVTVWLFSAVVVLYDHCLHFVMHAASCFKMKPCYSWYVWTGRSKRYDICWTPEELGPCTVITKLIASHERTRKLENKICANTPLRWLKGLWNDFCHTE